VAAYSRRGTEQRLRFRRSSNIFRLGAETYSLDEGQLPGRGEALFQSNLTDVLRAGALCALRRLLSSVFAAGFVLLLGWPVGAETDVFMRAVGFALTGSDKADLKVIGDRASCVFAIKNELFRLNNVYTDRIKIQGRQRQSFGALEQWVTVTLQGDEIIFEKTVEPPLDDGSELTRQMRVQSPSMFEPHHYSYTMHELHLGTNDQDGVKTAWQYVYSHGCTGKRLP
jgi:hypothetical protein